MKKLPLVLLLALSMAACATGGHRLAELDALADYNAVMIDPVTVEFDENWEPKTTDSRLPLSQREIEKVREMLAATFDESFRARLESAGVRVVDQAGPEVLRIKPQLREVWLFAPSPEKLVGTIYIRRVGSMQLYAEFSDANSNERLIVLQDDMRGRDRGYFQAASSGTNRFLLQQMFDEWALVIAEDLLGSRYARN